MWLSHCAPCSVRNGEFKVRNLDTTTCLHSHGAGHPGCPRCGMHHSQPGPSRTVGAQGLSRMWRAGETRGCPGQRSRRGRGPESVSMGSGESNGASIAFLMKGSCGGFRGSGYWLCIDGVWGWQVGGHGAHHLGAHHRERLGGAWGLCLPATSFPKFEMISNTSFWGSFCGSVVKNPLAAGDTAMVL